MNLDELKTKCEQKIISALAEYNKRNNTKFKVGLITWNNRLTSTAGVAHMMGLRIDLSTKLLKLNGMKFVNDTPIHELAHIISYQKHTTRRVGHGIEWCNIMKELGATPSRTHRMKTHGTKKADTNTIKKWLVSRGLPAHIVDKPFSHRNGDLYIVDTINTRAKQYPIRIRNIETNKTYKCSVEVLSFVLVAFNK